MSSNYPYQPPEYRKNAFILEKTSFISLSLLMEQRKIDSISRMISFSGGLMNQEESMTTI